MRKEDLFQALGEVGDDLLQMAEHKTFHTPWKKWASLAACLVLVVSLSVLALPYFPMGCGASMEKSEAAAPMESPTMDCVTEESAVEEYEVQMDGMPVEEEAPAEPKNAAGTKIYTAQDVQDAFDRGDHQWILETFVAPNEDIEGLSVKRISVEGNTLWLWVGLPETDDLYDEKMYEIRFDEDSWRYIHVSTPG